jgi:hypothetical protein
MFHTTAPRSVFEVSTPEEFRAMLNGDPITPKRKRTRGVSPPGFSLSRSEVVAIACDRLTPSPKIPVDFGNPKGVAEVIDELTDMKVDAILRCDYSVSEQIDAAISELRLGFRTRDRESFHHERVATLKDRLSEASEVLKQRTEFWNRREEKFAKKCANELSTLEERQADEIEDLTATWNEPKFRRRFAKKSSGLLNGLTIEKSLVILGDFGTAGEMRRRNHRLEQAEAGEKWEEMEAGFESARRQLLKAHEIEIKDLCTTTKHASRS